MEYDPGFIYITVSDNGNGYPSNLLDKIGEPYLINSYSKKNSDTFRPYYEGMGLGLFISKTLLENLGANVLFKNGKDIKNDKGAIVTVIFERKKIEVNFTNKKINND